MAESTKPAAAPPPTKALSPVDAVCDSLTKMQDKFKMALPPQISPERFVRNAMTSVQKNNDLVAADRPSFYSAVMESAQDGLLLDGKEATLTIYNTNVGSKEKPVWKKLVKYMPMVYGILKKVRNSGELGTITAEVVYEKDQFKFWVDDNGSHVEHAPEMFADRGAPKGVYALAKTKDGELYLEVLSKEQVEAIKSKSKQPGGLMWTTFWTEGWRKSAVRRLSKRLPMSTDLEIIQRDDEDFDLTDAPTDPAPEPKTTSSRLSKIVKQKAQPPAPEPQPEASAPLEAEVVNAGSQEEAPPLEEDEGSPPI